MFYYLQLWRQSFNYETGFALVQHVDIRFFVIIARLQAGQYSVSLEIHKQKIT